MILDYPRPKMRDALLTQRVASKYWQEKLDGHFTVYCNGEWRSRQGTDLSHKLSWLRLGIEPQYVIFGELCSPCGTSAKVKTAINAQTATFHPFAIANAEPGLSLAVLEQFFVERGLSFPRWGVVPKSMTAEQLIELHEPREGLVLKDGNLLNWRKAKRVHTYDCTCVRAIMSENRLDSIQCIVVRCEQGKYHQVSNMTTPDRAMFTRMAKDGTLEGTRVEIESNGRTGHGIGGLRHPRFVRVRDDL